MAQQVVTKVAPNYPASAREQGISGEVELYAAVSRDGAVEQVALVRGPSALLSAAADAVKQWRFRPYLVNGRPVEVDTTVWVDFSPSGRVAAPQTLAPGQPVPLRPVMRPQPAPSQPLPNQPLPSNVATSNVATSRPSSSGGGIDWEYDRHLGEETARPPVLMASAAPAPPVGGAYPASAAAPTRTPASARPAAARVEAAGIPQVGGPSPGNGIPLMTPLPPEKHDYTAVKPPSVAAASAVAQPNLPPLSGPNLPPLSGPNLPPSPGPNTPASTVPNLPPLTGTSAPAMQPATAPHDAGTGVVEAEGPAGFTEWKLIRKVPPVYPAAAATAGIEGVVVLDGVVEKDGTLHNLHAISGPAELQQAAVDAAAQYIYEPVLHGNRISKAPTQVAVDFLLTGPAAVEPEVMAGRLMNSFTPDYPAEALRAGVSGYVTLHAVIGRDGEVRTMKVVSGPEMLRPTALEAVKQWKWLPYKRNGVDVDVETDVLVHFSIPPA
jgi:TonB family protein